MGTVHDRFTAYVQVSAVTLIQRDREYTGAAHRCGTASRSGQLGPGSEPAPQPLKL